MYIQTTRSEAQDIWRKCNTDIVCGTLTQDTISLRNILQTVLYNCTSDTIAIELTSGEIKEWQLRGGKVTN